jgi:trigger factor
MQITETNVDGLCRELQIVVGADELERRLSDRLEELKDRVKLKGFRPGHVPASHIRRVYGRSVMAEVVQQAVTDTSQEALSKRKERPAFQPRITLPEDEAEVNNIISGSADLAYTMYFEVLPKIQLADFAKLEFEKPVADLTDEDIGKALDRLRTANPSFKAKDGPAETGDRLTVDFTGSIGGEVFQGGSAEDAQILLGRGGFIPGFEEGLTGVKAGEEREVDATFPEGYPEASLAGKTARFAVKVKEVASPETPDLDEDFAKAAGLSSLDELRAMVRQRLEQDSAGAARVKLKRAILDQLSATHQFELPPTLVDNEFQTIWNQVTADLKRSQRNFEDEGTTEDRAIEDYRDIAARRVRLGLVLSEIGTRNKIEISDDEVNRALLERARQFPGQERKVYDFYRNNPQMLAEIRAPIFEDKVIDFIVELAKPKEKKISLEELYADGEVRQAMQGDHDHHHHHDHNHGHDHNHHHDHDHDHHHDHDLHHDHDHDHGHHHHK